MREKIERACADYKKLVNNARVIIGFSGGADSSALLHYFVGRARQVVCVHINHMIRGAEADRDEAFCRSICEKYDVPLVCYKIDIPALAKERGRGIEETAREERYRVFEKERSLRGFDLILTAHNANDNVESVIFNLVRGSGANGLSGIKAVNGKIFRPLIYASRAQILAYCEENKIEYVTDSTNEDTDYTRNYIRHKVVPSLTELNPSLNIAVARLSASLRADEEYITGVAREFIAEHCKNGQIIPSEFEKLHQSVKVRVLKELSGKNLDSNAISSCVAFIPNSKCGDLINLCKGVSLKRESEYVAFVDTIMLEKKEFCVKLERGITKVDEIGVLIAYDTEEIPNDSVLYCTLSLNASAIKGELFVRSRIERDTILHGKLTKKLKKLFCDKKIPSHLRDKIPLVCDGEGIVAIPGLVTRDGAHGEEILIKLYKERI